MENQMTLHAVVARAWVTFIVDIRKNETEEKQGALPWCYLFEQICASREVILLCL